MNEILHLLREIALIGVGALVGLTAMAALTLSSRLDADDERRRTQRRGEKRPCA